MTRTSWIALRAVVLVLVGWLFASSARAQPIARDDVPPTLVPWIPWVLDDAGERACTPVDGQPTCVWPGRLALSATPSTVRFELDVVVERRSKVALPGGTDLWPEDVRVGTADAIVTSSEGVPVVWLPPGTHHVEGHIPHATRPDLLAVPAGLGVVTLELDGVPVATRWQREGMLWLASEATDAAAEDPAAREQERVELEVFRRIDDGVPLVVTTLLHLRVSGPPRDLILDSPLLAGGVLLAIESGGLPLRVEPGGDLVVSARAGKHHIELRERHATPPPALSLEVRPAPWPAEEIWAWVPRTAHRQVEPSGLPSTDASRTNAPPEWGKLQTFKARAPARLTLETTRRGDPAPPPNALKLSRDIYLDAERRGFTVVDQISGEMNRDYRLDFTGPGQLGHVAVRGTRDQLISVSGDRDLAGVELRDHAVSLAAEWRSEEPLTTLPAIGWTTDVESLDTRLHLPPGWELVQVTGADGAYGEWGAEWAIVDLAVLLGIALAAYRVLSLRAAVVVAAALMSAQHAAPSLRWWVLAAVALAAIHRLATTDGRLARWSRVGTRAAAIGAGWVALAFVAREGRHALWPATETAEQLELAMEERETEVAMSSADNKEGGTGTRAKGEEGSMGAPSKATGNRYGVRGPAAEDDAKPAERTPDEIVQTGHGVPRWAHRTADLSFTSAVDRGRTLRFILLAPWQSTVVALGRAGVAIALAWLLLREAFGAGGPRSRLRGAPYRAAAGAALSALLVSSAAEVHAEPPSKEVLGELRDRLTRPPPCAPTCADVASMKLDAKVGALVVRLQVHAEARGAITLPSGGEAWTPTRIEVDGKRAMALRAQDGVVLLRVERGTHEIELEGPVRGSTFRFAVGTRPHRVRTALDGWTLEGLDQEHRPSGDALVFHRTREGESGADVPQGSKTQPTLDSVALPPWLEVTRTLELGASWTVTTLVRRISPTGPPVTIDLPLLEGEKVVEGGGRIEGGKVTVDLGREAKEAKIVGAIASRASVALRAPDDAPWTETWVVRCSAIWQCRSDGVAPIEHRADGALQATFAPWPGEQLTLHLVKPAAAKGISTTIDAAVLRLDVGEQATDASLVVEVRSTTGGTQPIGLPAGARVTQLTVNGRPQPSLDGAALRVPIAPGTSHIEVGFKLDEGRGLFYRAPAVDLGGGANNVRVEIGKPGGRTVLWASGGAWGPVVLFWPLLLLLSAIAVALSRAPGSPLTTAQWLVLAPGLTQAPPVVGVIVVTWVFVVGHRRDRGASSRLVDGGKQLGIAMLTMAALFGLATCVYVGVTRPRNLLETEVWRTEGASSLPGFAHLIWYADKSDAAIARPWLVSTPDWVWKILVIGWAVAVVKVTWPFVRAAAARYVEGGVFRGRAVVAGSAAPAGAAATLATKTAVATTPRSEPTPAAAPGVAAPTSGADDRVDEAAPPRAGDDDDSPR